MAPPSKSQQVNLQKIRERNDRAEMKQKKYRYLYQVRTAHGDVISQVKIIGNSLNLFPIFFSLYILFIIWNYYQPAPSSEFTNHLATNNLIVSGVGAMLIFVCLAHKLDILG